MVSLARHLGLTPTYNMGVGSDGDLPPLPEVSCNFSLGFPLDPTPSPATMPCRQSSPLKDQIVFLSFHPTLVLRTMTGTQYTEVSDGEVLFFWSRKLR